MRRWVPHSHWTRTWMCPWYLGATRLMTVQRPKVSPTSTWAVYQASPIRVSMAVW